MNLSCEALYGPCIDLFYYAKPTNYSPAGAYAGGLERSSKRGCIAREDGAAKFRESVGNEFADHPASV